MKACQDCRHFVPPHDCGHEKAAFVTTYWVTGRQETVQLPVSAARGLEPCGPEAKLFELKGGFV